MSSQSPTFKVATVYEHLPVTGVDSCIMSVPNAVFINTGGTDTIDVRVLGQLLRQVSKASAEGVGEKLHHSDWVLTTDPGTVQSANIHDCPRCRASVDQALAHLAANPTEPLLVGTLYWAGAAPAAAATPVAGRVPPEKGVFFANPFLACDECGHRVTHSLELWNQPCGHRAGTTSVCPSWGPVDGCSCAEQLGSVEHGQPA